MSKTLREKCFSVPDTSHVPFLFVCLCSVYFRICFFFQLLKRISHLHGSEVRLNEKLCADIVCCNCWPHPFPLLLVRFMHLRFSFAMQAFICVCRQAHAIHHSQKVSNHWDSFCSLSSLHCISWESSGIKVYERTSLSLARTCPELHTTLLYYLSLFQMPCS